jgi:hypothetical protein
MCICGNFLVYLGIVLFIYFYDIHGILHGAICVPRIQYVF